VLGAHSLDHTEMLLLMSGSNTSYGAEAAHDHYYLKLADAALAAGSSLTVQANKLDTFENLNFDGSAETDAQLRLIGGGGSDVLIGGAKDDWISGGTGSNSLKGGGGADTFYFVDQGVFSFGDSINDLTSIDRIDLSAFDANRNTAGDDAFAFIGQAAFHHVAGELRVETDYSGGWTIQGDTNGDGIADVYIDVASNFTTVDGFHFIL
jgi:Ca2+-binding RTX toxin-like protein